VTGWWALQQRKWAGAQQSSLCYSIHPSVELVPGDIFPGKSDMIYLLTAIGLPPGGSSTVRIYTQTVHRTTQNKQYIEQHKKWAGYNAVVTYVHIVQRF